MTSNTRLALLNECKAALDSFLHSPSAFRIIRTVSSHNASAISTTTTAAPSPPPAPRTLFILDSSFNPPSRAHASLALAALKAPGPPAQQPHPAPHRLLLLFSVHNADKGAAPAAFEHRLAMMVVFAEDLARRLRGEGAGVGVVDGGSASTTHTCGNESAGACEVEIDVGLTTKPYYNDKSVAIETEAPQVYASRPGHVHITGFDTVTRIFNPKYYPESEPPLKVLGPFFERHGLRVTVRGETEQDEDGQMGWVQDVLGAGQLEDVGGKKEWAEHVELVRAEEEGRGVSSTKVRRAAEDGDWGEVRRLCTEGVGGWVEAFGLYAANGS